MFHTSQADQGFLFVCLLQRRRWIEYHIEKKTASSLAWKNLWNHAIAATGKKNKVCIYSVTKFPGLWWLKLILLYFSSESNSPVARLGLVYYSLYWQRVAFLFFLNGLHYLLSWNTWELQESKHGMLPGSQPKNKNHVVITGVESC